MKIDTIESHKSGGLLMSKDEDEKAKLLFIKRTIRIFFNMTEDHRYIK